MKIPSIKQTIFALIVLLVSGEADSQDPFQTQARSRIKEKVKLGVMNRMSAEGVRDTVSRSKISSVNTAPGGLIKPASSDWNEITLPYLSDELDRKLDDYGVVLKADKLDLIQAHIQEFAAFKAAVYSNFNPSPELAKVIAAQLARGIRWANRDDITYPNEPQREQAKSQINQVFSAIRENLKASTEAFNQATDIIEPEIAVMITGFERRTDSPFWTQGKKVFDSERLNAIIAESLKICNDNFKVEHLRAPASYQNAPKDVQDRVLRTNLQIEILVAVHAAARPLLKAYDEGISSFPTAAEQAETRQLLETLRNKSKSQKP